MSAMGLPAPVRTRRCAVVGRWVRRAAQIIRAIQDISASQITFAAIRINPSRNVSVRVVVAAHRQVHTAAPAKSAISANAYNVLLIISGAIRGLMKSAAHGRMLASSINTAVRRCAISGTRRRLSCPTVREEVQVYTLDK